MTTKTITGYYSGYTLKANYNGLTLTNTASIGFGGVTVTSDAYVTNSGGISAQSLNSGVVLNSGGTVRNNLGGSIVSEGGYSGGDAGVLSVELGNVVNYGYIEGSLAGVFLNAGGRATNSGSVIGNRYGVYTKGGAATVINSGTIFAYDAFTTGGAGVALGAGGNVTNGSLSDTKALIQGGNNAVIVAAGGTVDNFGLLTVGGRSADPFSPAVSLSGASTLINGAATDQVATISAGNGVVSSALSTTTVVNFGTILATAGGSYGGSTGVSIFTGDVTNGSATDTAALIEGYNAVTAGDANTVINFGTVDGTGIGAHSGYHGVLLKEGGYLTNGSTRDTNALIEGNYGVDVQGYAGAVKNFGTILATGVGVVVSGQAVSGGDVVNETTSSLIQGATFGIEAESARLTVTNFGTVLATGGASGDWGVSLAAGGKLTNGSATKTGALIEGYGGVDLQGFKPVTTNFGAIVATGRYGYGAILGAGAHLTNGAKGDTTATVEGYQGVVSFGAAATLTNFGTIVGDGRTAVQFNSEADVLVVEAGSVFEGVAVGDGGTIDLASGTGSATLLAGDNLTVSGSMAATTFSDFATVEVGEGAIFTVAAGGTIAASQTLIDQGTATVAGALTNTGILEVTEGILTVDGAVTGTGHTVIKGGTLDFASSFTQNVDFSGKTGVLELAQSQRYTGAITGFSLTGGTSLDLRDIGFASSGEATFSGTATSGTLTVTDGTHTAHITLMGDYLSSTFIASSDGQGGVTVIDPTKGGSASTPAPHPTAATHQFIAAMAGLGSDGGPVGQVAFEPWGRTEALLSAPTSKIA